MPRITSFAVTLLACCGLAGAAEVPAAPEDGGPRHWEVVGTSDGLNLRAGPTAEGAVVDRLRSGTILANMGCEAGSRRTWCYVQALGGGPVGYVAADYLEPAVSPSGAPMFGPDDSALRAGQGDFDATGRIPCAQATGQPLSDCAFGVARAGGGYATVVVTKPDGVDRALYFVLGRPLGADTSEADGYPDFSWSREADLTFVEVGPERYEIPDAVILGG